MEKIEKKNWNKSCINAGILWSHSWMRQQRAKELNEWTATATTTTATAI